MLAVNNLQRDRFLNFVMDSILNCVETIADVFS